MYKTRPAVAEDADTIARYNLAMALETEEKALDLDTVNQGVRRVFDEPSHGRYLVAESDAGDIVGCLMI
ncbi:MAG: GNAT family N-acetyltransferase, partial [Phycisphaeraceae bacterium]